MLFKSNIRFVLVVAANILCVLLIQSMYVSCEPVRTSPPGNEDMVVTGHPVIKMNSTSSEKVHDPAKENDSKEHNSKGSGSKEHNSKEKGSKEHNSKEKGSKEHNSKEKGSKEKGSKEHNSKEKGSKEKDSKEHNSKENHSNGNNSHGHDSSENGSGGESCDSGSSEDDNHSNGYSDEKPDPAEEKKWWQALSNNTFPEAFFFGVSTSAYQTEGAYNVDGKGLSVWDFMTHAHPGLVDDRTNADDAVQFYYKYGVDILNAKKAGAQMFSISLSWTRIFPNGIAGKFNEAGVAHYHKVIDTIIKNGMHPMVTLFYWDLPYELQKLGGVSSSHFVTWFYYYAEFAFKTFGSKVKHWITWEDGNTLCTHCYGGPVIPALNQSGIADYLCGHYLLLAHAKVFHLYREKFHKQQKGMIGFGQNYVSYDAQNSSSPADVEAARKATLWHNWLALTIFEGGNYPLEMIKEIAIKSKLQRLAISRLPSLSKHEQKLLNGSADFLSLSYSYTGIARAAVEGTAKISFDNDAGVRTILTYPKNAEGLGKVLRSLQSYKNLRAIFITHNGRSDTEGLQDWDKVQYLRDHLMEVLKCMQQKIRVLGYSVRSLTDAFEWNHGYRLHFGLYGVNSSFVRIPRMSLKLITDVYKRRYIRTLSEIYGKSCSCLP